MGRLSAIERVCMLDLEEGLCQCTLGGLKALQGGFLFDGRYAPEGVGALEGLAAVVHPPTYLEQIQCR